MDRLLAISLLLVCATIASSSHFVRNTFDHLEYLRKYKYLPNEGNIIETDIQDAISEFQTIVGIEKTGSMNSATLAWMLKPRCGHHDYSALGGTSGRARRMRRYALEDSSWEHTSLTYKVSQYSTKLNHSIVDNTVARALQYWSDVTNLQFTGVSADDKSDIDIKFATGDHGDGYPFSGAGGIMAHASPPPSGEVHFDNEQIWVLSDHKCQIGGMFNLLQVMVHEFGHALGLDHSSVQRSVMFPVYHYEKHFSLTEDDVLGIQKIYGEKTSTVPLTTQLTTRISCNTSPETPTTTTTVSHEGTPSSSTTQQPSDPPSDKGICADPRFDAVLFDGRVLLAFKGAYYYKIFAKNNRKQPHNIQTTFPGAPSHIDTALKIHDKYILFKGNLVYLYTKDSSGDFSLVNGYPAAKEKLFTGLPAQLKACFWNRYRVYCLGKSGDYYSTRVPEVKEVELVFKVTRAPVDRLPSQLDAVYSRGQMFTYFFSGNEIYRTNNHAKSIISKEKISDYLLHC